MCRINPCLQLSKICPIVPSWNTAICKCRITIDLRLILILLMMRIQRINTNIQYILYRAGIFKQSTGARNRVGIELSNRPARLHRLAEFVPWNRFLCSINVYKYGLSSSTRNHFIWSPIREWKNYNSILHLFFTQSNYYSRIKSHPRC